MLVPWGVFCFLQKLFFESIVEECELFFYVPLSEVKHVWVGADFIVDNRTSDQYSG